MNRKSLAYLFLWGIILVALMIICVLAFWFAFDS